MSGPCSLPNGNSRMEYAAMWNLVCDIHHKGNIICTPDNHTVFDKHGDLIHHAFITKREWLARRNKLRTGKTK